MSILKTGFLFAASESANHIFYKFLNIGDDEVKPISHYSTDEEDKVVKFNPREVQNLEVADEMMNFGSINDMKIEDLTGEGNP